MKYPNAIKLKRNIIYPLWRLSLIVGININLVRALYYMLVQYLGILSTTAVDARNCFGVNFDFSVLRDCISAEAFYTRF